MNNTTTIMRLSNPVAITAGAVTGLLSGVVLAGYATGMLALVKLVPWSAPMRLPVAAGLFFCALAVLLLAMGWKRTAAGVASAAGLVGLELLRESVFEVHVAAIETAAFAGGPEAVKLSGRLTTLAGACLILTAAALLFMTGVVRPRNRLAVVGVLGSIIGSVGAVAFLSYVVGMSSAFGPGHLTALGMNTAFCLALLGLAVIRFAWADSAAGDRGAPAWLPALVGIGILSVTICLWEAMAAEHHAELQQTIEFDTKYLKDDLEVQLDNRVQPLVRLARRREALKDAVKDVSKQEWDSDVQGILTRGGYQAIQWVDPSLRTVWATPPGAGDLLPDGNSAFEERRKAAFEAARTTRTLATTRPVDLVTGGKGMLVCVPVVVGDELKGYVTGVFRYNLLLKTILTAAVTSRYSVSLSDGGEEIYSRGPKSAGSEWVQNLALNVPGANWRMHVSPGDSLLAQANSPTGGALLIAGCVLALVFALLTRLLLSAPRFRPAGPIGENFAAHYDQEQPILSGISAMPVISYSRDGTPQAWNPAAKDLFGGSALPVIPAIEPFRAVSVAIVRGGNAQALRILLDSCSLPALAFEADGAFSLVNTTATRGLGWTAEAWRGRRMNWPFTAGDLTNIAFVLILQGQITAPAESETATGNRVTVGSSVC